MPVDKQKPDKYIYNEMMSSCAKAGYFEKVFEIFRKMRDRGIGASDCTYTILFNACANSPFKEEALSKALYLKMKLKEDNVRLNLVNYHSIIKAFGRLGEINIAFQIVDEMIKAKVYPTTETFNFLLQAAISDKKEGFKLVLVTWHKMLKMKVTPSVYSYNLLLRAVRECSVGSQESLKEVISLINSRSEWEPTPVLRNLLSKGKKKTSRFDKKMNSTQVALMTHSPVPLRELLPPVPPYQLLKFIRDGNPEPLSLNFSSQSVAAESPKRRLLGYLAKAVDLPNLVARNPNLKGVINIEEVGKRQDRLALCGGLVGILQDMNLYDAKPNLKTCTELMLSLPDNSAEEELLIEMMKLLDIEIDVDFCNMLIKKRAMSKRHKDADKVIELINELNLRMNNVTFGVLAFTCISKEKTKEFMKIMKLGGFRLNQVIAGSLINNATFKNDCNFLTYVLDECSRQKLKPDTYILKKLEDFRHKILNIYKLRDQDKTVPGYFLSEDFNKSFRKFSTYYRNWLRSQDVVIPEHPWGKFKYTEEEAKLVVSE
ncbi:hypothetical protein QYM36_009011 [Artemia franciscana]|nr:hypothetical protein QYM36_009011 [Artemia franciscana]